MGAVAEALESQRPVAGEGMSSVLPLAVDGSERAFRLRTTPMRDNAKHLLGAVTILEDITHLREIDRLKSEFIATASHELRTPLTSVQMGVHLLLEGALGELTEQQDEVLQACLKAHCSSKKELSSSACHTTSSSKIAPASRSLEYCRSKCGIYRLLPSV